MTEEQLGVGAGVKGRVTHEVREGQREDRGDEPDEHRSNEQRARDDLGGACLFCGGGNPFEGRVEKEGERHRLDPGERATAEEIEGVLEGPTDVEQGHDREDGGPGKDGVGHDGLHPAGDANASKVGRERNGEQHRDPHVGEHRRLIEHVTHRRADQERVGGDDQHHRRHVREGHRKGRPVPDGPAHVETDSRRGGIEAVQFGEDRRHQDDDQTSDEDGERRRGARRVGQDRHDTEVVNRGERQARRGRRRSGATHRPAKGYRRRLKRVVARQDSGQMT